MFASLLKLGGVALQVNVGMEYDYEVFPERDRLWAQNSEEESMIRKQQTELGIAISTLYTTFAIRSYLVGQESNQFTYPTTPYTEKGRVSVLCYYIGNIAREAKLTTLNKLESTFFWKTELPIIVRTLRNTSRESKRTFQLCVLYDGTGSNDETKFADDAWRQSVVAHYSENNKGPAPTSDEIAKLYGTNSKPTQRGVVAIRAMICREIQERLITRIAECWLGEDAKEGTESKTEGEANARARAASMLAVRVLETKKANLETGESTEGAGYIDVDRNDVFRALTTGPNAVNPTDIIGVRGEAEVAQPRVEAAWTRFRDMVGKVALVMSLKMAKGSPQMAKGSPQMAKGSPQTAKGSPQTAKGSPQTAKGSPQTAKRADVAVGNPTSHLGGPSEKKLESPRKKEYIGWKKPVHYSDEKKEVKARVAEMQRALAAASAPAVAEAKGGGKRRSKRKNKRSKRKRSRRRKRTRGRRQRVKKKTRRKRRSLKR